MTSLRALALAVGTALLLPGCSTVKEVLGSEDPCDRAARLSEQLGEPVGEGARTFGELEDELARYGAQAEQAAEAAMECLREQPLPR